MHQHSSCGCGERHAAKKPACNTPARPVIQKITTISAAPVEGACCQDTACASGDDPDDEVDRPAGGEQFSWLIGGMDCPSCARKIETAVKRVEGVSHARVIYATEKLVVNAGSNITKSVEQAVKKAGFSLKSAKTDASEASFWQENRAIIVLSVLMLTSWILSSIDESSGRLAFIATTLAGIWPVGKKAVQLIRSGTPFAIETLMSIAAIGALFIGATAEAAMVLLLFLLGERLESFAASRARRGVTALMALKPDEAVRLRGDQRETVAVDSLRPGDRIEVAAGARLPADALLLDVFASFDESALTGESVPVERQQGEKVAAGCTSVDRQVQMEVVSRNGESAIDRILHLIEQAEQRRAPIERFLDRFSRYYTPVIMALALLVTLIPPLLFAAEWQPWIYKGLTLLLIGCPCALVISTPAAITSALAAATRRGALIKGGAALESLGAVRTVAFDKTGTLTEGKPVITDVLALNGENKPALLLKAAAVETGSSHPLARAIVAHASTLNQPIPLASDQRALAGSGVEATVNGRQLLITAPAKLTQLTDAQQAQIAELESAGKTTVVVLEDQQPIGLIALRDRVRDDAQQALSQLQELGITSIMLTGDNPRAAAAIAAELGIDYRASLLPADKVQAVAELNQQQPVAMVGDGINDAPAMKAATIGIAMGGGSDVALETADAALTHNHLTGLAAMIRLSRATHANIRQNIAIALGLKAVFLLTTLLGMTGLWLAVLADSGATALVTANALRLLRKK
ncbi:zinc/cadmium/mercury/lead-transporting ATPase [Erwiniaceae bacterium BAC15a-03b]|uniref:P-type Zn(2+) transporter n=1 Tax=Winslowiella arboricola TaxID=2978220 RepID=A0A9J6PLC0_9GAMM|nr:zinc/cadmium/mercury/lead-transporting ATPase [Winslowiella arboricola]MCU5771243.1 zinc/cadmium/mercury/lead-transporting ATPase [Winslowiella arboricola]MCU5777550.1 zinc/cadmium/mercury/lead-transporting ATPase [Winslowiella arboricola]